MAGRRIAGIARRPFGRAIGSSHLVTVLVTKELRSKAVIALLAGCLGILAGAGPAAAQGVLDANCPGPPSVTISGPGDHRFAQTFAAQGTGSLVRGEIEIGKSGSPGGNWVMQILATDATGKPTNTVLASTTIADASVPDGPSRLVGVFASPLAVGAGQQYALALTRPGANTLTVMDRSDNPCPGDAFLSLGPSGAWFLSPGIDEVFAVYVKPPNAFTLGGTTLNKRKGTATVTVNVPYAGELIASGKGVRSAGSAPQAVSSRSVSAGSAELLIKAKGKKKRKLNETGKVKLNVAITYTPTGGDPGTQSTKLKLRKR